MQPLDCSRPGWQSHGHPAARPQAKRTGAPLPAAPSRSGPMLMTLAAMPWSSWRQSCCRPAPGRCGSLPHRQTCRMGGIWLMLTGRPSRRCPISPPLDRRPSCCRSVRLMRLSRSSLRSSRPSDCRRCLTTSYAWALMVTATTTNRAAPGRSSGSAAAAIPAPTFARSRRCSSGSQSTATRPQLTGWRQRPGVSLDKPPWASTAPIASVAAARGGIMGAPFCTLATACPLTALSSPSPAGCRAAHTCTSGWRPLTALMASRRSVMRSPIR